MKIFGGGQFILKPEDGDLAITEQLKSCLIQLQKISLKKNISIDSFYKTLLFLNTTTTDEYNRITEELKQLVKHNIHKDILVIPLAQPPVDFDVLMEVYYCDPEQWSPSYFSDTTMGAVIFKKDGVMISSGYASSNLSDCRTNALTAFSSLETLLSKTGFSFSEIRRQWNYIEEILHYDGPHQHYQIFNDIRAKFYADNFKMNGYPAATGIGMKGGGVIIEYISTSEYGIKTIPIDNNKQIPAYKYNEEFLKGEAINKVKATPKFERGRYLSVFENEIIYVSGTASISGEQVIYPENSKLQTLYTIENINELTSSQNLNRKNIQTKEMHFEYVRIYVKNQSDFLQTQVICEENYVDVPYVLVQADICRDDLLVEIEGFINIE